MSNQKPFSNHKKQGKQFKKGRGASTSNDASNPLPKAGRAGAIQTNWKTIDWTPKKLLIASILIGAPYLAGVIASLSAGLFVITFILIGLGGFVGILYGILRWLEQAEL